MRYKGQKSNAHYYWTCLQRKINKIFWSFYPSEPFKNGHFNVRHPVFIFTDYLPILRLTHYLWKLICHLIYLFPHRKFRNISLNHRFMKRKNLQMILILMYPKIYPTYKTYSFWPSDSQGHVAQLHRIRIHSNVVIWNHGFESQTDHAILDFFFIKQF